MRALVLFSNYLHSIFLHSPGNKHIRHSDSHRDNCIVHSIHNHLNNKIDDYNFIQQDSLHFEKKKKEKICYRDIQEARRFPQDIRIFRILA